MFFFSFWENNNNNNNNAVSLQKNITEPFRRLRTQHLVDTRSLRFGNKTVKRYQKLHYNTNQENKKKKKKKPKAATFIPIQMTWTWPLRPLLFATCLSKHYKNCSAVHGRNRRWKITKIHLVTCLKTAMITAMHGLMSYTFPTAVREILKGLLR